VLAGSQTRKHFNNMVVFFTNMNESIIKNKLINLLKKDFRIIENIIGLSFYDDKKVIPDFAFCVGDSLFIVEVKDDTTNNFSITELLRQAITYKFATYDNIKPTYVFITTTKMLKGDFNKEDMCNLNLVLGLANKLGIGRIYLASKKIQIGIGSNIFYKYFIENGETEFDFQTLPSIIVGTNAKSNKFSI
jgi:hypothetical protein